jgi:endonuclease/exonuclease/phosphatase family metal-dependent hydrolase
MLRVVTFNILHGRSLADGRVSTERLVGACESLEADVLCLQEVDRGQPRSGGVDQAGEIAARMGAAAWRFEPALVGEPGAAWRAASEGDHTSGERATRPPTEPAYGAPAEPAYGIAIVSRSPVESWDVVRLAAAPVRAPVAVPGGRGRFVLLRDEPRVALVARLVGLTVATTHLSFVPGYNLVQLRRLAVALARRRGPCVLVGDLNAPSPLPRLASGWASLASVKTYPAGNPWLQVDHALGRGAVPRVRRVEGRRMPLSDHLALIIDLEP